MPSSPSVTPPRGLALLLAAMAALGPFSIDAYLPSFHAIGSELGAGELAVQQTLTYYLAPFALMTLWHGALSDAYGRKRVVLAGFALFALASVLCALAPRIEVLWLGRLLQGVTAGAGIVISRALIRDLFDGAQAQKLMAHVAIMFALAPAVAPVIGGWLETLLGWRAVFVFLAGFALALLVLCWRYLPETLPHHQRQPFSAGYLLRAYRQAFTQPAFMSACLGIGFFFMGFFVYVLSAPVFLMQHLGLGETQFYWLFGPGMGGLMIGSWLSGRLAGRRSPRQLLTLAMTVMGAATLLNLAVCLWLPPGVPQNVLAIGLYTVGMSVSMPVLTLLALDIFPTQRGLAASVQSFVQSAINSLASIAFVPFLWAAPLHLTWGQGTMFLAGGLMVALYFRHERRQAA
ncbi:MFS transporter, DHA1 family, multidrug resistance protein [Oryzomicrobium terrae]|uniref:Bcr/CflA family efflux transporter n=1 Tax=Oryzomicrobium terrae TaxID=1735038 RepID=A0A5C1E5J6_9RHOO|nr:multidrug effflux MFS transporter [Oryzomicrobium terrae]QEL63547.1 MFS transporter, DHA1 family, multidrug resistance protein [Oryzomicrobium terrae]